MSFISRGSAGLSDPFRHIGERSDRKRLYSYTGNDPIGLELAGALKNVYAIASGMSEGLGFENNTRASQSLRFIGASNRVLIIKSALILLRFNYAGIVRDDSDWCGVRR